MLIHSPVHFFLHSHYFGGKVTDYNMREQLIRYVNRYAVLERFSENEGPLDDNA